MISEKITQRTLVEECNRLAISAIEDIDINDHQIEINTQIVGLTTTKCYFGGERVWFLCPACSRRIGVLYRPPLKPVFLCRHCHDLTYELRRYHRSGREQSLKALRTLRR